MQPDESRDGNGLVREADRLPRGGLRGDQRRLSVVDGRLHADGRDRGFAVGALTLPSLAELRARTSGLRPSGRLRLSIVEGDVRAMHALPVNAGALFQVASQFNMLEMVAPSVTPEEGVTRYQHDRTQGPACAMAAGAATIYRNYLVSVAGGTGQTATRQLDGLADLGAALARRLGPTVPPPWTMRNGYAMATREGLAAVDAVLREADAEFLDDLRGRLRVGLHADVEVTDGGPAPARKPDLLLRSACRPMPVIHPRRGRGSPAWSSRRPTRRRSSPASSTPIAARRTASCSPASAGAPSATPTSGSTTR